MDREQEVDSSGKYKTVAELLAEDRPTEEQSETPKDAKSVTDFDPTSEYLGPTVLTPPSYRALWRNKWDGRFEPISRRTILVSRILSIPAAIPLFQSIFAANSGIEMSRRCLATAIVLSFVWFPMWWAGLYGRFPSWTNIWAMDSHPHFFLLVAWIILLIPYWVIPFIRLSLIHI